MAANNRIIPRGPLRSLALALLLLVPTMAGNLAAWVTLLFLVSLLAKFVMERRGVRLRQVWLKALMAAAGFTAVVLSYGSWRGIEPGVSIVVILASLKILEAHTARDFHILILVSWVLCLCGFFMSQDLAVAICVFISFLLLLTGLIQFHRGPVGTMWPALGTASKLALQSLPLVAIMFLLFPRLSGGFGFRFLNRGANASGFSDHLSPGSVAAIVDSPDTAFRVEFPGGKIPSPAGLYWRGIVLWEGNGLEWTAGSSLAQARPNSRAGGEAILQRITVEPHGERWLFALDSPLAAPAGATLMRGRYLRSTTPISSTRRYEVSSSALRELELSPRERSLSLQPPAHVSPAVRDLVQSWSAQNNEPQAVVKRALEFFRKEGFVYSASPGAYGSGALDELLFHRKIGFCEHYAASFATLMRVAGIPSRVVMGYLGGQWNQFGKYFLVRQSDAHAWCEVWLPGRGWERVDPTSVIAPDRINVGFGASAQRRAASAGNQGIAGEPGWIGARVSTELWQNIRLGWDTVNFAWDTHVMSFDAEAQQAFLTELPIADANPGSNVIWLLGLAAGLLGGYGLWISLKTRRRTDAARAIYERFCRKAARLGAERALWEGPGDFGKRAALLIPRHAQSIGQITNSYIALRYSREPSESLLKVLGRDVQSFSSRNSGTD
ncbi:MAG: DUF3488 and transglutaminase-like domain-containing protein [Chthoniobacterales bacterium]